MIFFQTLRTKYDNDVLTTGGSPLLLTAAVSAGKTTIDTAYEIDKISQWVDLFSIYLFSSFLAHLDRRTMWTITIAITLFYSPFVLPRIVCECLFLFSGASIGCSNFLFVCPVWYNLSICIFGEHVLSVPTFFFLVFCIFYTTLNREIYIYLYFLHHFESWDLRLFVFSTPLWIVRFTSICIFYTTLNREIYAYLYFLHHFESWDLHLFVFSTPLWIVGFTSICIFYTTLNREIYIYLYFLHHFESWDLHLFVFSTLLWIVRFTSICIFYTTLNREIYVYLYFLHRFESWDLHLFVLLLYDGDY